MDGEQPVCGYAIRRAADQKQLVRARAVWAWLDRQTRQLWSLVTSWPASLPDDCTPTKPLRVPPDSLGARSFRWQHTVRCYELDSAGHVNPMEILRWLEETKFAASAGVGWSAERMAGADFHRPGSARHRIPGCPGVRR